MCICFLCHQLYLHLLSLKTRHQLWTFEDLESIFDSLCSTFDKKCRYYLNTAISNVKKRPSIIPVYLKHQDSKRIQVYLIFLFKISVYS